MEGLLSTGPTPSSFFIFTLFGIIFFFSLNFSGGGIIFFGAVIFGGFFKDALDQSRVRAFAAPSSPGQLGAHDETRLAKTSGQNNIDLGN